MFAEQPAPAPQLAHPEGCDARAKGRVALRIVLVSAPLTGITLRNASRRLYASHQLGSTPPPPSLRAQPSWLAQRR